MSFYVSTATFFLLNCDVWDRVGALPRHKFVTGATLLQLVVYVYPNRQTSGESATVLDGSNRSAKVITYVRGRTVLVLINYFI